MARAASSDVARRTSRPTTHASSPSYSMRLLMEGNMMGSPGPTTDVDGFRNTSGSSGTSVPISAA